MCYDDKFKLPQDKHQIRYKETYKGPLHAAEFSTLESRLNLPDGWIYNRLVSIGYISKTGEVKASKTLVEDLRVVDTDGADITARVVSAISNRGRTHIVATGVIAQVNPDIDHRHQEGMYEGNLNKPIAFANDRYSYLVQETCKNLRVNYNRFMAELTKLAEELLNESEEQTND